ncbi:sugar kinase [Bacillus taeanensis]|uniref:Sugar kinase n=1 Tax=Bacillus taeanensis TaxID=273032 RepID=A0A366XRZ7_9BACI|nr:sugar kinase [Bacillus taeanensis]RBW68466.1 sugar kinase [Bacillus taeanensis]
MNTLDVVTFGEAMAMFVADEPGALHEVKHYTRALAGAETNVAIGLARLGFKTGWASKVGKDSFGKYIMKTLQLENINIDHVVEDRNHPTGFQVKSKVLKGDPEVQYFRKGSAASTLSVNDCKVSYFTSARYLHMTGIPLALSSETRGFAKHVLLKMKAKGRTISFDPNLRPALWESTEEMVETINEVAFQTDWVLPGIGEGEILTGCKNPSDIAAFYLEQGVKLVVIKLGAEGAYYKTAAEEGTIPGFPVREVIDTVGAGDGFAVGTVSGLLDGLSIREAVLRGNAIGALAVQTPGDSDGLPNREGLTSFMQTGVN